MQMFQPRYLQQAAEACSTYNETLCTGVFGTDGVTCFWDTSGTPVCAPATGCGDVTEEDCPTAVLADAAVSCFYNRKCKEFAGDCSVHDEEGCVLNFLREQCYWAEDTCIAAEKCEDVPVDVCLLENEIELGGVTCMSSTEKAAADGGDVPDPAVCVGALSNVATGAVAALFVAMLF